MTTRQLILGLLLFVVGVGATAYLRVNASSDTQTTSVSYQTSLARTPARIVAQGRLQPISGVVNISAEPGDQIDSFLVENGEEVLADQPLVKLKSGHLRKLEAELATMREMNARERLHLETKVSESRLSAARLALRRAELAQQQLNSNKESIQILRGQQEQAERDLGRLQNLASRTETRSIITPQQLEQQELLVKKLSNDVINAESQSVFSKESGQLAVKAAQLELTTATLGHTAVPVSVPVESLAKQAAISRIRADMSTIAAPISGRVLKILACTGEHISGAKPLLQLGDTKRMVCLAEIYESNLQSVVVGQAATLTSPALPQTLRGTVTEVGCLIGSPSLSSPNPLARVDRRTAEVKIELDADSSPIAAEFVNLQVEVEILLDEDEGDTL